MTTREPEKPATSISSQQQSLLNMTIIGLVGQVGCLTLLILLAAVLSGLWLDTHFGTRPWVTIGMLVLSIPISLVVMFFVSRSAAEKLKRDFEKRREENTTKEDAVGKDS